MIAETLNFGLGLLALILLYGVVVSAITSPPIVLGWALGYGRAIFRDPSDQARLVIVFHFTTTAIIIVIAMTWLGARP